MINTHTLLKIAKDVHFYGDVREYYVRPYLSSVSIPEWDEKLGRHTSPRQWVATVEDVTLAGPGLVGLANKYSRDVILDTTYFGRIDLFERNLPYFQGAMASLDGETKHMDIAVSLGTVWTYNYFHFIIDILPKLEAITHYQTETGEFPVILIPANPPRFVLDIFDYLDVHYITVDGPANIRVERLVIPSSHRQNGFPHPGAIEYLRDLVGVYGDPKEKIYVSRELARSRRVSNETKVMEALTKMGFYKVCAESFPWRRQLDMFSNANVIAGPHGAGLVNMVFGNNPIVLELVTPEYTNPCCWLIGEAMGIKYGCVLGTKTVDEDISIDVDTLIKTLKGLE